VNRSRASAPQTAGLPESFNTVWLAAQLDELLRPLPPGALRGQPLCVAFSGGLDSTVLLAALASLRRAQRLRLRALHVNHHLHPDSGLWAAAAARQARRLRVSCELLDAPVLAQPGESLEAAARRTRYGALAAQLRAGELLLTAHHQEDQLETVLLALLRGSGLRGLAAMNAATAWSGTWLLRPLLPVSRVQLERYAAEQSLSWSEDPSNFDERFDRNYLRQRVVPLLRQRWPAVAATVVRSAAHLAEARGLLDAQARRDLAAARDGAALRVSALLRLSGPQRRNALRYWIIERGLPPPDHRRLREITGPMLAARADALPQVSWRGGQVRRHADQLFALAASGAPANREGERAGGASLSWHWREQPWIQLRDGSQLGLIGDAHGDVRLDALPAVLQVSFRQGGERLRGASGRVALKDLLQTQGLAPWERARVPLIGDGERLLAVGDLWVDPVCRVSAERASAERASAEHATDRSVERARFRWRRAVTQAPP
jgi:tRNA(Ile)-lysidine synthase